MRRIPRVALLTGALASLVVGCSGSTNTSALTSAADRVIQAERAHSAAAFCAAVTPAFWAAVRAQAVGELRSLGQRQSIPASCVAGDGAIVRLAGPASSPKAASPHLADIVVHGGHATAVDTAGGAHIPVVFVRASGTWRVDCCTGAQLDDQPTVSYRVPSPSMLPTVTVGQTVIANNQLAHTRPPTLGEIVTFHPPVGADHGTVCGNARQGAGHAQACDRPTARESIQLFIKRVVGLPGDRISIVNGVVIRNGLSEGSAHTIACGTGALCNFPKAITIPPGEYFVLGDDRGISDDSRFWGPVKRAWIVGIVSDLT